MGKYLFFILFGFLSGSILYSYWIPKQFLGIDITALSDDHNPGTANALEYAGLGWGMLCLVCDLAKGFLPIFFAAESVNTSNPLFAFVLVAPVLGHAFSPFFKGRGGKAIAVSCGALLGVFRYFGSLIVCLVACLVFFSTIVVIHPNTIRMIVSYLTFSVYCVFRVPVFSAAFGGLLISSVVIFRHLIMAGQKGPFRIGFLRKPKEVQLPTQK